MTSSTMLWNDSKRARLEIGAKHRRWSSRKSANTCTLEAPTDRRSANPNKKAADLISFDAFADDEGPLSGNGGLALPEAGASSSASAMTASGLPVDLFSTPSPANSPGFFNISSSSSVPPAQRQNPMAFFQNTPPPQATPPPQQQQFGGGLGGLGGMGMGVGSLSPQPRTPTQGFQPQVQGYGVPTQPSQPLQPTRGSGQQTAGQQPKKDAFADLVDLMG